MNTTAIAPTFDAQPLLIAHRALDIVRQFTSRVAPRRGVFACLRCRAVAREFLAAEPTA